MTGFEKPGSEESREKYARFWFDGLAKFHRIENAAVWEFDEFQVRAFLRSKLEKGMPTWKRIKIVEGLIWYRNRVRKSTTPRLESLRAKLQEVLVSEKQSQDEEPIESVVGKIDPREPDVIQAMRRALRVAGLKFNTEKAYTGKVIAFMHDRGLKNLSDFAGIGAADVEAHLTDLAVDGDVAPTTQNQAFYALLFLFEHVLKRDIGKINALRSTKAPRIPSVMSKAEVVRVLAGLVGIYLVIGQLLYGCGMRISEAFVAGRDGYPNDSRAAWA